MKPTPKPSPSLRRKISRTNERAHNIVHNEKFRVEVPGLSRRSTASIHNIVFYGREFTHTFPVLRLFNGKIRISLTESQFESPIGVRILFRENNKNFQVGMVRLGFEKKKAVIIEAVQGGEKMARLIGKTNHLLQEPWANFLVKLVETSARENGFSAVKIRAPETLHFYKTPAIGNLREGTHQYEVERNRVQDRMIIRYYEMAKALGYRREGEMFVKEL